MESHLRKAQCPRLFQSGMPTSSRSLRNSVRTFARSGLTLIEIMIALTITLVVLFAMAQAFQYASNEIAKGRAVLEMSNRLRNAQQLMRIDLGNRTVQDIRPYTDRAPRGYFEYMDGVRTDNEFVGTKQGYKGDTDDIVAMTCRKVNGSYRGRFTDYSQNSPIRHTVESQFAEIIWFTEFEDRVGSGVAGQVDFDETLSLYRRVLLISPERNREITPPGLGGAGAPQPTVRGVLWTGNESGTGDINNDAGLRNAVQFFINNDLSARWIDSDGDDNRDLIVANSLDDLARRENRFGRDSRTYPYPLELVGISLTRMGLMNGTDITYSGDDILLTDVAAFDFRLFSSEADVVLVDVDNNGIKETMLTATDNGYYHNNYDNWPAGTVDLSNSGSYIDLGKGGEAFDLGLPQFTTLPSDKSQLTGAIPPTYCTWSPHYEVGRNGTNGIDDDGLNGVDDQAEWETAPPYPYRVRGAQIVFRIVEKDSRQIRQATVVQNFIQ